MDALRPTSNLGPEMGAGALVKAASALPGRRGLRAAPLPARGIAAGIRAWANAPMVQVGQPRNV